MSSNSLAGAGVLFFTICACSTTSPVQERTQFSRLDSLTETYLVLNDSILMSWNRIVSDELAKSKTFQELIDKIKDEGKTGSAQIESLQLRILQLDRIRFNQKNMDQPHVVEEYDKACVAIVNDLISNTTPMTAAISTRDWFEEARVAGYYRRAYYDSLASTFNNFILQHKVTLRDLGPTTQLDEKPMFWQEN
jgi:hypothetical protein